MLLFFCECGILIFQPAESSLPDMNGHRKQLIFWAAHWKSCLLPSLNLKEKAHYRAPQASGRVPKTRTTQVEFIFANAFGNTLHERVFIRLTPL